VNRMAIRNNPVEIENDSLQHGDKMNEFPNLFRIGLRHAMADRAEDGVRRAKVRVFNVLHIVRRHDETKIGQRSDATARKTGKNKRAKPEFARLFQAQDDVWRITAAGNCENGVSFSARPPSCSEKISAYARSLASAVINGTLSVKATVRRRLRPAAIVPFPISHAK